MTRRIMAVAVISSAIALVLFLLPLAIAVFNLFLADAQATLERDALHAAIVVDPSFSASDRTELPKSPPGDQLGLYDASGGLIVGTGPHTADAAVRRALAGQSTRTNTGGLLVAVVPISASESVTGAVRAATPLSGVWQRTLGVWLILALAAAAALAVGIIAAGSLARRITRRVEQLTLASQTLGDGDFDVRTTPSGLPEIDRAGAALNMTAERLGDLVMRERHLAANASHQLRTPLTGLRLLLESGLSDPKADHRGILGQAIERADQLDATIDALISLARGGSSGSPVNPVSELEAVERRWRGVLESAGRPLRLEARDDLPHPVIAEVALRQILDAVLENAVRHGSGQVTLRARESHGAVAFDVTDEGNGIPLGADIFGQGVSFSGGSGLGLALARQLAEDQGARLLLSARVPRTQFTLLVPVEGAGAAFSLARPL
ncbi:HAMP domain-containing sensor histidine kinase [Glaciibacter sp. 2TAF33]|uniref:HAMP domain-containing sensor histidine kinase n=1 Tax=Glaciibacter sp. 2TAF33 TaxID=3233015 RepID=UPI003F90EAE2